MKNNIFSYTNSIFFSCKNMFFLHNQNISFCVHHHKLAGPLFFMITPLNHVAAASFVIVDSVQAVITKVAAASSVMQLLQIG